MDEQELRSITGTIFNVQHYCIHDGPGIRTNVFVKGCPLRCLWCANPESQEPFPQIMYRSDTCLRCGACIAVCPQKAVTMAKDHSHVITDRSKCTGCGKCAEVCQPKARERTGYSTTAGAVFDEVAGDALFYGDDGGITITGGEALAHPKFTSALLQLCRNAGIKTAVETCGYANWDIMEPVIRLCDVVLYDVKEMDSKLHKQYTGVSNEKILDNLKKINDLTDCEIWVRVPTIPGYNDDEENITAVGRFVKDNLSHCTQVHLLPFHNMGISKFQQLENTPNGFSSQVPENSHMEALRDLIREMGIICK